MNLYLLIPYGVVGVALAAVAGELFKRHQAKREARKCRLVIAAGEARRGL